MNIIKNIRRSCYAAHAKTQLVVGTNMMSIFVSSPLKYNFFNNVSSLSPSTPFFENWLIHHLQTKDFIIQPPILEWKFLMR